MYLSFHFRSVSGSALRFSIDCPDNWSEIIQMGTADDGSRYGYYGGYKYNKLNKSITSGFSPCLFGNTKKLCCDKKVIKKDPIKVCLTVTTGSCSFFSTVTDSMTRTNRRQDSRQDGMFKVAAESWKNKAITGGGMLPEHMYVFFSNFLFIFILIRYKTAINFFAGLSAAARMEL